MTSIQILDVRIERDQELSLLLRIMDPIEYINIRQSHFS